MEMPPELGSSVWIVHTGNCTLDNFDELNA